VNEQSEHGSDTADYGREADNERPYLSRFAPAIFGIGRGFGSTFNGNKGR
jgi:hypothetical protein